MQHNVTQRIQNLEKALSQAEQKLAQLYARREDDQDYLKNHDQIELEIQTAHNKYDRIATAFEELTTPNPYESCPLP